MVLLGFGDANVALAGVTMLVAHAMFKAALFMVVGIIDHSTGTRDLRKLARLGQKMPVLAVIAAVAAASMAGLPFTFGFVAKEAAFGTVWTSGRCPGGAPTASTSYCWREPPSRWPTPRASCGAPSAARSAPAPAWRSPEPTTRTRCSSSPGGPGRARHRRRIRRRTARQGVRAVRGNAARLRRTTRTPRAVARIRTAGAVLDHRHRRRHRRLPIGPRPCATTCSSAR